MECRNSASIIRINYVQKMNVNYATRSFMIVRKFFNVWLQVVLWNLNVNYVARDLLTQIPRECKKELNTSYKSSQSYSRGWETDCTLCSFEPTMKVKWCQRCKRKQRRSMMVATPPVSPAIRQVGFLVKVLMRREWNVQLYQRWTEGGVGNWTRTSKAV